MTTSGRRPVALVGGTVVVSLEPTEVVAADLVIDGDRIIGVGPAPAGALRRDCSGTLLMPGTVCCHHHLYSALARGMPFDLEAPSNFLEILQRVWWRLDRALDEESVRASALIGGLEALKAGTTSIVDHHASPNFIDGTLDVIAESLGDLGVRSVLCYEVTDRDGKEKAAAGLAENARFLARSGRLTRGMVGAHASFTLSEETLSGCVDLARSSGAGVHIHVAEDGLDERDCLARFGVRVADRLAGAGVLGEDALLAHCIHVDRDEIARIEHSRATVVCNPRSNMNNGVGHSPFALAGGRVALGTDGIGGNMVAEAQAGYFRLREADLSSSPSWPLERWAEGARFVGGVYEAPLLGTLRPGAPADVAVLSYDPPTPIEAENLAGHLVFGLSAASVRDVYVAGELVIAGGMSTRVDEAELAAETRRTTEKLWRRLEETPAHDYGREGGADR